MHPVMLTATRQSLNKCFENAVLIQTLVKFSINPKKIPAAVTMG